MFNQIIPAKSAESFMLSHEQRQIWISHHFPHLRKSFNHIFGIRIACKVDTERFNKALREVVAKHDGLRTLFLQENGIPKQKILDINEVCYNLNCIDLHERDELEQEIDVVIEKEQEHIFDLNKPPLFRINLVKVDASNFICVFNFHRIVFDKRSEDIFIKELLRSYVTNRSNEAEEEKGLESQSEAFAVQFQKLSKKTGTLEDEEYWTNQFKGGLPPAIFPLDSKDILQKEIVGESIKLSLDPFETNKLRSLAANLELSLLEVLFAVYAIFIGKITNREELIIGTSISERTSHDFNSSIGLFEKTLPIKAFLNSKLSLADFLFQINETLSQATAHKDFPIHELRQQLESEENRHRHLPNEFMFNFENQNTSLTQTRVPNISFYPSDPSFLANILHLLVRDTEERIELRLSYAKDILKDLSKDKISAYFKNILKSLVVTPQIILGQIDILDQAERNERIDLDRTAKPNRENLPGILRLFDKQVISNPEKVAIIEGEEKYTYRQIEQEVNQLAQHLQTKYQIVPGELVGVLGERSTSFIIGLLAVLKIGGAFVPIDNGLSKEEKSHIFDNSQISVLLATNNSQDVASFSQQVLFLDNLDLLHVEEIEIKYRTEDLCCVLYDFSIKKNPPGVKISHANLSHFVAGTGDSLPVLPQDSILATTSLSSQKFLLEFCWPLCAGIEIQIHPPGDTITNLDQYVLTEDLAMDFSLFFFASYNVTEDDKYKLLKETVKYGDKAGFSGVWTPERHFHEFGGLFPNPSVTSAALAMITEQITLRSGSVVSPLHDSIRIAEEWAVVDNLSHGRVELSFAPGWNFDDFTLSKEDYENRHAIMHEQIDTVKKLWSGGTQKRTNGIGKEIEIKTFPTPIQEELPIWVTAAGNENTFIKAGEIGANLLTHLLGQSIEELTRKIKLYRESYNKHGHSKNGGKVAVMLHTFVGDDQGEVEKTVEQPFFNYIKSATSLSKILYREAGLNADDIPEKDRDIMLKHSLNRYYENAALIGTKEGCLNMVRRLKKIGVDEVACLVDFGIESEKVLSGLEKLNELKSLCKDHSKTASSPVSLLQVKPSEVKDLLTKSGADNFFNKLKKVLLCGESVSREVIDLLRAKTSASIYSLYGYSETTSGSFINILKPGIKTNLAGLPVGDAHMYVLNHAKQFVPVGTEGEVYIGGGVVSEAYWNDPALSLNNFIPNPFQESELLFKTGDQGTYLSDGSVVLSKQKSLEKVRSRKNILVSPDEFLMPKTELEARLRQIWAEALGVKEERISVGASFFSLGGDALAAIHLTDKINNTFSTELEVSDVFFNPSIQEIAWLLEQRGVANYSMIPLAPESEYYPISCAQKRIYERISTQKDVSLFSRAFNITGDYTRQTLFQAIETLVDTHESLRTQFHLVEDKLRQQIKEKVQNPLKILTSKEAANWEEALQQLEQPFDLSQTPLLRIAVYEQANGEHYLLCVIHKMICDADSLDLLMSELICLMNGDQITQPKRRYIDHASWQYSSENDLKKQRDYWAKKLQGTVKEIDLPTLQDRDEEKTRLYKQKKSQWILAEDLYQNLIPLAESTQTPLSCILFSAYTILLSRLTDQVDFVIAYHDKQRPQIYLQSVIGNFTQTLPVRIPVSTQDTLQSFLDTTKTSILQAMANQELPYDQLLNIADRDLGEEISNTYYSLNTKLGISKDSRDWHISPVNLQEYETYSPFEFGLEIFEDEHQLALSFAYAEELYDEDMVALFKTYFTNILSQISINQAVEMQTLELETA